MEKPILSIQNISKSFFNKTSGNNYVLKNLNLDIPGGQVTALIGGNGSGKTTLFNIISRLIEPDNTGKDTVILFDGTDLLKLKPYALASLGIGRLFQDAHIFPELSIMENMCVAHNEFFGESPAQAVLFYGKTKHIENKRQEQALEILTDMFGADSIFVNQYGMKAGNLSYGQQRLLGLARLFMGDYRLLLLDEPTAGVNFKLNKKIADIIQRFKQQGKTVFLIEHNMAFVKKTADYVAFLNEQHIFAQGKPEDILNDPVIQQHYLGIL